MKGNEEFTKGFVAGLLIAGGSSLIVFTWISYLLAFEGGIIDTVGASLAGLAILGEGIAIYKFKEKQREKQEDD